MIKVIQLYDTDDTLLLEKPYSPGPLVFAHAIYEGRFFCYDGTRDYDATGERLSRRMPTGQREAQPITKRAYRYEEASALLLGGVGTVSTPAELVTHLLALYRHPSELLWQAMKQLEEMRDAAEHRNDPESRRMDRLVSSLTNELHDNHQAERKRG